MICVLIEMWDEQEWKRAIVDWSSRRLLWDANLGEMNPRTNEEGWPRLGLGFGFGRSWMRLVIGGWLQKKVRSQRMMEWNRWMIGPSRLDESERFLSRENSIDNWWGPFQAKQWTIDQESFEIKRNLAKAFRITQNWFKFIRFAIELSPMAIARIATEIKIQKMIGMKRIVSVRNDLIIFIIYILQWRWWYHFSIWIHCCWCKMTIWPIECELHKRWIIHSSHSSSPWGRNYFRWTNEGELEWYQMGYLSGLSK
jgi:hypothetical protein